MNKKEENNIFVFVAVIGALLSFLIGVITFFIVDRRVPTHADKVLEQVKEAFRADGPIEGSWIEMTKVPWKKYAYDTEVYYGGISRYENGQVIQYEFIADAYTGSIMNISKI